MTRLGLWPPHPPSTSACTDANNIEVTDWLGITIRKINVGVPAPKSGGQASNLRGKQLENWGLQGLRSSWLPGFSPPRPPDMGAVKGNHGSEVGVSKEQGWGPGRGGTGRWGLGNLPRSPLLNPKISQHHTALWSPIPPLPKTR